MTDASKALCRACPSSATRTHIESDASTSACNSFTIHSSHDGCTRQQLILRARQAAGARQLAAARAGQRSSFEKTWAPLIMMRFSACPTNEASRFALLTPHPHACIDAKIMYSIRCLPCTPRGCREALSACVTPPSPQCGAVSKSIVAFVQDKEPPLNTCCRGVAFPRHFNLIGAFPPNLPFPHSSFRPSITHGGDGIWPVSKLNTTTPITMPCDEQMRKLARSCAQRSCRSLEKVIMKRRLSRQPSRSPRKGSRHAA